MLRLFSSKLSLIRYGTLFFYRVLFLFSACFCQGQEKVKVSGQTLDIDSIPIPFATIKVVNELIGTYSDDKGHFSLVCGENDTLEITAIGYKKEVIVELNESLNVFLSEKIELLNEVVVTPDTFKNKKINLGNFKNKSSGGFLGEYASMLKIDNQHEICGDIVKIIFKLYKKQKDKNAFSDDFNFDNFEYKEILVRLLLLGEKMNDDDSLVSLIKTNITKKLKSQDQIIEFELDTLLISLPKNGVYVGIEMLGC